VVDDAVALAVAKQWLRPEGATYILTEAGAGLGSQSNGSADRSPHTVLGRMSQRPA
jgi:hypothetical protein